MTVGLELLALAALIALNAFFVAAEYGLVTSRRTRILELEQQGNRRARDVRRITADPPRFISAMQLGVTITSLAIGALGEPLLAHIFEPAVATVLAVILALLIITYLHVVLGELVPKGIALAHPERTALAVSTFVRAFFVVFAPFIWLLRRSTEMVLGWLGLNPPGGEHQAHSEAELRMLLSTSADQGEIEHGEQEMVYKVFDFADKEVADVMVPRPEVIALSAELTPEEVLDTVLGSPFTRYPVYRGSFDEIAGILHVRDLFAAMHERGIGAVDIESLLRPAAMVPETKDLAALLTEFRRTNQHMAIVIDEYGAVEGIVTLEDLLEEIVGEIEDEFDLPDETVERVTDDTIRIDGTFPIDDFNEEFGVALPLEDYHTIAGFVFGALGRAPEPGDEVSHEGTVFRVDSIEGQRIDRLTVTFDLAPAADEAEPVDNGARRADP
jgi:CBS domain containing-hemolysin-like protein